MDKRKKQILEKTIIDYIDTAEPVGSNSLIKRHNFSYSSATIRNELNDLVKDGYLTHLHTSSGRVPTDKGYRYYVDTVMANNNTLAISLRHRIERQISVIGANVQGILVQLSQVVSSIVDYTAIVVTPTIFQETLKAVHLVLVDLNKVLVVLLNSLGVNREFVCRIEGDLSQDDYNKISKLMTEKLEGKPFNFINEETVTEIFETLPNYQLALSQLLKVVNKFANTLKTDKRFLTHGTAKMLKLPEFENIECARKVIELLEEAKLLSGLFESYINSPNQCRVLIGNESGIEGLEDCSVVIAPYKFKGKPLGGIGILGPKRMRYSKLIPLVKNVSQMVENIMHAKEKNN